MPAGEVAIAPMDGTAEGTVVADVMVSPFQGVVQTPVEISIHGGRIVDIQGGREADALRTALERHGAGSEVVAEVALGTNPAARSIGIILEDEKRLGTAHVGFGHAVGLGGTNQSTIHADAILADATLMIDGVPLVRDGQVTKEGVQREPLDLFDGAGGEYDRTDAPTRTDDRGRLHAAWTDVGGAGHWAQVGNDQAATAAAEIVRDATYEAPAGSRGAQIVDLLVRYGVVKRRRR